MFLRFECECIAFLTVCHYQPRPLTVVLLKLHSECKLIVALQRVGPFILFNVYLFYFPHLEKEIQFNQIFVNSFSFYKYC